MDEKSANQFFSKLAQMCKNKLAKPIQIGNTVFLLFQVSTQGQSLPQGTAEVHAFSTESPENAIKRYQVLPATARQLGYKNIAFVVPTASLAVLLQANFEQAGLKTRMEATKEYVNNRPIALYKQHVAL